MTWLESLVAVSVIVGALIVVVCTIGALGALGHLVFGLVGAVVGCAVGTVVSLTTIIFLVERGE